MSPRLSPPCDLWVVPPPHMSRWFARMDWYLNWQMCRGLAYVGLHLPGETLSIAAEHAIPVPEFTSKLHLLVATGGRVPAKMCLVMDGAEQLGAWLGDIGREASRLRAESVHVFLPSGPSVEDAEKLWQQHHDSIRAIFTSDLESTA